MRPWILKISASARMRTLKECATSTAIVILSACVPAVPATSQATRRGSLVATMFLAGACSHGGYIGRL